MNGQKVHALWDTGAQVSLLPKKWLDEQLPGLIIRKIESILDDHVELDLKTANGTRMPYEGWVEVEFNLETSSNGRTIMVPMLVTGETLDCPIIGYNVIEELVKHQHVPEHMAKEWAASFPDIHGDKVESLVSFIQTPSQEQLCVIKTAKQDVVIPSNTTVRVKCRANTGPVEERIPVLFEPNVEPSWPSGLQISEELLSIPRGSSCQVRINVSNTSNHDITLRKRTVLGELELVKSVTPSNTLSVIQEDALTAGETESHDHNGLHQFDLNGLTPQQERLARKMLEEERESFSKDDNDIGCIKELDLKLNLTDQTPVQKTYNAIPRPLYPEVKQHIEDLLNRGWITKSKSPYSSPVVCVRKKNGELRLCVDYRELNKRTTPDRHPLPRAGPPRGDGNWGILPQAPSSRGAP